MSRLKRDSSKRKLEKFLAEADDEKFCRLIWAVDALQSGREAAAARLIRFPPQAITSALADPLYIHKWTLETLVNELLSSPKRKLRDGRNREVDCSQFNSMVVATNLLRDLENLEDGLVLDSKSVLLEMARIAHRQFAWQNSVETIVHLYRSMHLFGGPACAAYFEKTFGLTLPDFVLCGFAAYSMLDDKPAIAPDLAIEEIGLSASDFQKTMALICLALPAARSRAQAVRLGHQHISYRESMLRRSPCIAFGTRITAPIRELLLARVTSGIYYDVVPAAGDVTREIGERFESYCLGLLAPTFDGVEATPSYKYKIKGNPVDSPDLFLREGGTARIIVECKAKRMPFGIRFGNDPQNDPNAQDAFEEVAKGIFQVWRFRAHLRRGILPDERVAENPLGLVLTLDPWLSMARGRYQDLIARAMVKAEKDGQVLEVDRCPIAFCSVEDLESVVRVATWESFQATIVKAANAEFGGWHFAHIHRDFTDDRAEPRGYVYTDRIGEVLPWWNRIKE